MVLYHQIMEEMVMAYNQFKNNRKLIMIVGIALVVMLIGLLVYRSMQFRITGTNPSMRKITYITSFIEVGTNHKLASDGLSVLGSNNIIRSFEVKDKKIIIGLQNMKKDTDYSITLTGIKAENGKIIPLKTLDFRAQDSGGSMPKDQEKYAQEKQQEDKPKSITDPILSHLPHSTLSYHLSALSGDKLILQARLTPSKADLNSDKTAVLPSVVDATKKEIDTYIRSLKLDPANYTIEYTVITPSAF